MLEQSFSYILRTKICTAGRRSWGQATGVFLDKVHDLTTFFYTLLSSTKKNSQRTTLCERRLLNCVKSTYLLSPLTEMKEKTWHGSGVAPHLLISATFFSNLSSRRRTSSHGTLPLMMRWFLLCDMEFMLISESLSFYRNGYFVNLWHSSNGGCSASKAAQAYMCSCSSQIHYVLDVSQLIWIPSYHCLRQT